MWRNAIAIGAVVALVAAAPTHGQQSSPACAAPENRQFDFWLGDWEVTVVGTGQIAGTNNITSMLGGCVLHEAYETPTGYRGNSFNSYDGSTGQWHQTWVDNAGAVLTLDGGLVDGKMVLSGPGRDAQGNEIVNQITWTPHEDGAVQQTWLVSSDGGSTWTTAFDGLYRKKSGS